jgi:hypothetical protein
LRVVSLLSATEIVCALGAGGRAGQDPEGAVGGHGGVAQPAMLSHTSVVAIHLALTQPAHHSTARAARQEVARQEVARARISRAS